MFIAELFKLEAAIVRNSFDYNVLASGEYLAE